MDAAWVATVVICVATLSFAFVGQNKLYNFIEKSAVGFTVGHTTVVGLIALRSSLTRIAAGETMLLVPIALGILYFCKFAKKSWTFLATVPTCLVIGTGIGLGLRTAIQNEILKQLISTYSLGLTTFANVTIMVIVASVILMFTFTSTVSHLATAPVQRLGRWCVMFTLGVLWTSQGFDRLTTLSTTVVRGILAPFLK